MFASTEEERREGKGRGEEGKSVCVAMRHAVDVVALALLLGVAEGWAPKKNAPMDLTKMRPSSTRGRAGGVGASVVSGVAGEHLSRRQLQVGNYDLSDAEANTRAGAHWDDSKLGLSGYNFDPPTHQGAVTERYGYDPVVHVSTRDPNAPPTEAEMYPLLLNMDSEHQMAVLAADYLRNKSSKRATYTSEWCQRSAILPGESECSAERSLQEDDEEARREEAAARIQALLDALGSVLSGGNADDAP